jgi:putative two-component system response regulator
MARPYKRAWTTDDAHQEVLSLSGTHFDPAVVAAFNACFNVILEIRAAYPDLPEK